MSIDKSELGPLLARGRTADIYALSRDAVIKVLRTGFRDELIQIEADRTRAVAGLGLPAPRVLDVTSVAGRPALVVERVDGESMLSRLTHHPQQLVTLARLQADLHANLTSVRAASFGAESLPPLTARLTDRIGSADALSADLKQGLLNGLLSLSGEDCLCHGDFHPDNIILGEKGPVIIDWLDATSGPAAADAARSHLLLSLAAPPQGQSLLRRAALNSARTLFRRAYLRRYRQQTGLPADALAAWMPIVAAARLAEGVNGEADRLVALAENARNLY